MKMKIGTAILTEAGAAAVDISPRNLRNAKIWMSGYMPIRYATEQADPIMARSLALGGAGNGLLIVSIDTCLISPLTASRWARAIARSVPVPEERIFIITTHTHSGPDFSGLFGGVPPAYYFKARAGIIESARLAWDARKKAALYLGTATHNTGLPRRRKHKETDIDREAVVLQFRGDAGTIATLINLGCHGVVYQADSQLLSSDLPGALCRTSDAAFGGVSLFVPRIQGDVNPNIIGEDTYHQKGNAKELDRLAREGLAAAQKAAATAKAIDAAPFRIETKRFTASSKNLAKLLFTAPWWNGRLPDLSGMANIDMREFGIGGVEGMAVPGEVLTGLGRALIARFKQPALLFSYCGGYMGYMMTREIFDNGGYEPGVSPGPIDPCQ